MKPVSGKHRLGLQDGSLEIYTCRRRINTIISDYSFAAGYEKGNYQYPSTQPGGGSKALRTQLSLSQTVLWRALISHPACGQIAQSVTGGLPSNAISQVLSEPGKQYAIYLYRGDKVNLELLLPAGNYEYEWLNTLTGKYSGQVITKKM